MLKMLALMSSALLLGGGLLGIVIWRVSTPQSGSAECAPGYMRVIMLEPIQPGSQASKVIDQGCRPNDKTFEVVELTPIQAGEERWSVEDENSDQGEAVNGIILGPSEGYVYRCVILLQPIRASEQYSRASEAVCAWGPIDSVNGVSLASNYLIAKFYDRTNYRTLLVEYYGASACSPTISYGVADLGDNLDNRFASGQTYSNCDHLEVFDFNNYSGPSYACGANCPSFYALNDEVSSWRTGD